MRYRRLFDVRTRHDYFLGGPCPDLAIELRAWPSMHARMLSRHRLVARPQPDGVEILGPVDDTDQPLVAFADELRVSFDVRVSGDGFAHYTDLSGWPQHDRAFFRGEGPSGGPLALNSSFVAPPGVIAGIEIVGISAAWLAAPPRFVLELKAQQTLWAFYLLTARPGDLSPQIVDGEQERALEFQPEILSFMKTARADDPVGHGLLVRHPDRRCFRMLSRRAIACRSAPLRRLGLQLGGETLIRELPGPSIHDHALVRPAPVSELQSSLFRVIEF